MTLSNQVSYNYGTFYTEAGQAYGRVAHSLEGFSKTMERGSAALEELRSMPDVQIDRKDQLQLEAGAAALKGSGVGSIALAVFTLITLPLSIKVAMIALPLLLVGHDALVVGQEVEELAQEGQLKKEAANVVVKALLGKKTLLRGLAIPPKKPSLFAMTKKTVRDQYEADLKAFQEAHGIETKEERKERKAEEKRQKQNLRKEAVGLFKARVVGACFQIKTWGPGKLSLEKREKREAAAARIVQAKEKLQGSRLEYKEGLRAYQEAHGIETEEAKAERKAEQKVQNKQIRNATWIFLKAKLSEKSVQARTYSFGTPSDAKIQKRIEAKERVLKAEASLADHVAPIMLERKFDKTFAKRLFNWGKEVAPVIKEKFQSGLDQVKKRVHFSSVTEGKGKQVTVPA